MKLYYMAVFDQTVAKPVELVVERDMSSFSRFTRGNVAEFMTFFSGLTVQKTKPHVRHLVEEQSYHFHAFSRPEGICGIIISDIDYPKMVAQQVLSKICDEFLAKYPKSAFSGAQANTLQMPELKEYIQKYQNPENADSIMRIQKELDETKIVLHKTIESVLERGEKIDNLVAKSDGLSAQSKMFYTQAKKQNSCCVVM